jgi:hypothetical protein
MHFPPGLAQLQGGQSLGTTRQASLQTAQGAQTMPQTPQLVWSVWVLVQWPPQQTSPAEQVGSGSPSSSVTHLSVSGSQPWQAGQISDFGTHFPLLHMPQSPHWLFEQH